MNRLLFGFSLIALLLPANLRASGCEELRRRREVLASQLGLADEVIQRRETVLSELVVVDDQVEAAQEKVYDLEGQMRYSDSGILGQSSPTGDEAAARLLAGRQDLEGKRERWQELNARLPSRDEVRWAQDMRSRHDWELRDLDAQIAACAPEGWRPTQSCPYDQFGPYSWYRVEDIERALRTMREHPSWTMEQAMGAAHPQPMPACVR